MHTAIRRAGFGALIATLAFAGVACSDDDDSTETGSGSGSGTEETTTTAGEGGGDGDVAAFCDAFIEVTQAFESEEPPSEAEGEAILAEVEATAPEEVAEPVAEVAATAREALGGDEGAFDDAFFETLAEIDAYRFDNCPTDEQVEVTAIDYAFEGVPETVAAGQVAFRMTNDSEAEEHEMIVFAKAEGETRSFEEIVALPEEESESAVVFIGATFAPPGGTGVVFAELEPGDYAMACFVPVGGAEDGPPHVSQGMLQEFTVS